MQCRQLPAAFHAAVVPSINFWCTDKTLQQLLVRGGNFCLLPECQQTFRQLSVHPRVHPSTFHASEGPSVNFPCLIGTFRQHKANFRASAGPFINFLCGHRVLCKVTSTFCAAEGPSVNFPCGRGTFCKLPSTFLADTVKVHCCVLELMSRQILEQITAEESFNTRRFNPKIFISCTKLKESRLILGEL